MGPLYINSQQVVQTYSQDLSTKLHSLLEELKTNTNPQHQKRIRLLNNYTLPDENLGSYWIGISARYIASHKELWHQQEVIKRFFAIEYEATASNDYHLSSKKIFDRFWEEYQAVDQPAQGKKQTEKERFKYNIKGLSSRSRIILLYNIARKKLEKSKTKNDYFEDSGVCSIKCVK